MDEALQVEAFLVGVWRLAFPQIPAFPSVGGHRHRDGAVSLVVCLHDAYVTVLSAFPADYRAEARVLGAVVSVREAPEGVRVSLRQLRALSQYLPPPTPTVSDTVREDGASAYLDAVVIASVREMDPVLVRAGRCRRPWLEGNQNNVTPLGSEILYTSILNVPSIVSELEEE